MDAKPHPVENNSNSNISNSTDPLSDYANVILTTPAMKIVYWFLCSFGFLSNIFVVVVIRLYKPMHKQTTNLLITSQSVLDAMVAVFLFFTTLYEDDGHTKVPGRLTDELLCRLWYTKMPLWGLLLSSTYGIVALTIEKFLAVVYPIWHKTKFVRRKILVGLMVGVPWFFGPLFYISLVAPTAKITSSGRCTVYSIWPDALTRNAVGVFTVVIQLLLPLTILIYCYTKMALILHKRVDMTVETTKPGEVRRNESMVKARGNVIKTLIMIGVGFVVCWSWNQGYYLLRLLDCCNVQFNGSFYSFSIIAVSINSCIDPIIYTVTYKQFQKGIRSLICRGRVEDEITCAVDAVTDITK